MKRLLVVTGVLLLAACSTVVEGERMRKVDPVGAARDRVALAAEYLKKGDNEKALTYLRLALKTDPDSADAHNLMGVLLERDGALKQADKEFRKAVRLRDGYSQAHNNYGSFLFRRERYKEAMVQFGRAAEDLSYPNRALAFEGMGRSAWLIGKKEEAAQAFSRALRLDPNLPMSILMSAEIQFDQKNLEAAHNLYKRYLELTPNTPQTAQSLWLGIRLERRFGNRDALASYELALKRLYPASPEYQLYQESLRAQK
ncbi:MAG: type pilus biosis/stability protein PilW [Moraxellaceae bacterium]|jgi:type IV pilus assembly protein PilF|nr:type pilus biosis/stability protein PilW [Moraxellaceae bacterium]